MSYNNQNQYGYNRQQGPYDQYGAGMYAAQEEYPMDVVQEGYPVDPEYFNQEGMPLEGGYYDQQVYDPEHGGYYEQSHSLVQDPEKFSDFSYGPQGTSGGYDKYAGGGGLNQYTSSNISYGDPNSSGTSTFMYGGEGFDPATVAIALPNDPYPAWTADSQSPVSVEQIEDVFIDLTNRFGFQRDSMRNIFDHFMVLLDSRSSRMSPHQALLSLHADYIGGDTANYKKWYFAAQLDMDDEVGFRNMKMGKLSRKVRKARKNNKKAMQETEDTEATLTKLEGDNSLEAADYRWKAKMNKLTPLERVRHIALYLLMWGEANQVRFTSECLCFLYKCALDYLDSPLCQQRTEPAPEGEYLNFVITPLYRFLRNQVYEIVDGRYVKRERDHNKVIGYDDVNQLFWYPEGISRIVLKDGTRLIDLPSEERYLRLNNVAWESVFFKTYKETRTWLHVIINFNRIWILHGSVYWMYTAFNSPALYTKNYNQLLNNQPTAAYRWSSCALAGLFACGLQLFATMLEWMFVPRNWAGAQHLSRRFMFLLIVTAANVACPGYVFLKTGRDEYQKLAHALSIVGFFFSLITVLFFSIMPLGGLFTSYMKGSTRKYVASQTFTASFAPLCGIDRWLSYLLWVAVFTAKFCESYFFLTLSLRDPIRILWTLNVRCTGEQYFGNILCRNQSKVVLFLMVVTDFILFFLDTYMWYIVCNTVFSVGRSFYLGISILTPWRNIFTRLPKRIYSKILATSDMEVKYKPKVLISQVWNAIVISMYREHLLGIDHVQKLLYHQVPSEIEGKRILRAPTFFVSQDDNNFDTEFFSRDSEAERRISFFAQSLATPIPEPLPVDNMPTFTVLTPHYSERILLSLREIIREADQFSRVTLLEYLKQLHPIEWDCFVKDTKILSQETAAFDGEVDPEKEDGLKSKIDDLPFYCIGFKSAAPEYTLRTRIWASLRSQTLYRTISGMMNYARAIKLLYRVENPEIVQMFGDNAEGLEKELERMSRRKFRFLVSMQRLAKFEPHEMENAEFLLRAYPNLQIAYLDEEPPLNEGEEPRIYSALIDGHCEFMENGHRRPKFRIQLSGNPILGDGKSDNQNHALIFYRGEYIQLVDANQDNYLEECLKIRSVLAEFEELNVEQVNPYAPGLKYENQDINHPVAIVGAREYIFSENSGVLGDTAAGKEQTFGTLFSRTLAQIGAKLHYGHPDFINATFMTTRCGLSKAQKGLHLNEDIYAGMNAILRGGIIKHSEYYQCGKGRDLGFGTILNFTTKIGAGMGEQLLSREYYYLGTQLPIDRFLSFYYAHPGFQLNNLFIQLSLQMFILTLINMNALAKESILCEYKRLEPITSVLRPFGCSNLVPVVDWVRRYTLSIFIVFFIAFVPIVVQELIERGLWKAIQRFVRHLVSLSPMFEVFAGQIYSASLISDMTIGGARYISTGRGFATSRIPFSILYSRFAGSAIYMGARSMLMLLFSSLSHWQPALLWFWASMVAMMFSPFIFNPHQFAWQDFFLDYRDFVRWLSRGNAKFHKNSWIGYVRMSRSRITGFKRKLIGNASERLSGDSGRAHKTNVLMADLIPTIIYALGCFIAYTFVNAQTGVIGASSTNSILRIGICTALPIVVNIGALSILMVLSCCAGPLLNVCCKKQTAVMAAVGHCISVLDHMIAFILIWMLERMNFGRALIGLITMIQLERVVMQALTLAFLTREIKNNNANAAFWSGKWYKTGLGYMAFTQPAREFVVKIIEMSEFAADFFLGHILLFLQFPLLLVPQIDKFHSIMLFWLKPSRQIRPPIYSLKQAKLRRRVVRKYSYLYFLVLLFFVAMLSGPPIVNKLIKIVDRQLANQDLLQKFRILQPFNSQNDDTGDNLPSSLVSFYTATPSLSDSTQTRSTDNLSTF